MYRAAKCNIGLALGLMFLFAGIIRPAFSAENLAVNGGFEEGVAGWAGSNMVKENDILKGLEVPSFISWETKDTAAGSKGSLRAVLKFGPALNERGFWSAGVNCLLKEAVPAGRVLKIAFDAKSISGSPFMSVVRSSGGSDYKTVELSRDWKHYEVEIKTEIVTQAIIFSLRKDAAAVQTADGEFLLDNVTVTVANEK